MDNSEIVSQTAKIAASAATTDELLRAAVSLLRENRPYYNWVGIYLLDGGFLTLHNYVGKPTEHSRIAVGTGVCGAAVADRENKIVGDVTAIENYLACSVETRSEIVVLIRRGEVILGQIDIDSNHKDAFTVADEELLSGVAEILAEKL
ncbi:MAG TPA: GAF domain-containing protein [Blastocatellia bacterium]|nr:GAF domain-containing protein [Blastocatellia bacterium]